MLDVLRRKRRHRLLCIATRYFADRGDVSNNVTPYGVVHANRELQEQVCGVMTPAGEQAANESPVLEDSSTKISIVVDPISLIRNRGMMIYACMDIPMEALFEELIGFNVENPSS
ncbi:hypothetical protein J1614_009279 [Plenodomus biglobosus]|nr:hypothetical protein J1614_009279 [Plenodomus biglobosus]